jgi:deoxyribonuclease-4
MLLGAHISSQGQLKDCLDRAERMGVSALQISTRSATRWFTAPLEPDDVRSFRIKSKTFQPEHLFALCSPLINLASKDSEVRQRSVDALYDELMRAEALGIAWVVAKPGNHNGRGEEWGFRQTILALNTVLEKTRSFRVGILLETSAGEENALGYRFEHLAKIRRRIEHARRIGVCLDINRLFGAGYEMRDLHSYNQVVEDLHRIVGLRHVKAVHLADSLLPLGNRSGAATHIGEGEIGSNTFAFLVNDTRLDEIPFILNTPRSKNGDEDITNLNRLSSLLGTVTVEPTGQCR